MKDQIVLRGNGFILEDLIQIARNKVGITISKQSEARINKARNLIDKWVEQGDRKSVV